MQLSNAASTHYEQQPYHLVEQPDINFLLPYYSGGYGYNCYGWPSYTYYGYGWPTPYYSSPIYPGWGYWPTGGGVIIINQNNNNVRSGGNPAYTHHGRGHSSNRPTYQVPPEIATRNQNISHVATPAANTIQTSPSYEIRPVDR